MLLRLVPSVILLGCLLAQAQEPSVEPATSAGQPTEGGFLDALEGPTREKVSQLKFESDVLRSEARKELSALQAKYDDALARLEAEVRAAGDLDNLLKIQAERKNFSERSESPTEKTAFAKLDQLIEVYHSQLPKMLAVVSDKEANLIIHYAASLEEVVSELTRAGKIEQAKVLRDHVLSLRDDAEAMRSGSMAALSGKQTSQETVVGVGGSYQKVGEFEIESEGNLLSFSTPGANRFIRSERNYRVPFRFSMRAMVDSTNLRVYFGQSGQFILNWERKESEFRFHHPVTGKGRGYRDLGAIAKGVMHDIDVEVDRERFVLRIDGEERLEISEDFSTVEGPVGVGSAQGSRVTIESLVVTPLE